MIDELRPYPEYKESGLPWVRKLPKHWGGLFVKQAYEIQLGKMLQNVPLNADDSSVPYLKSQHVQWSGVRTSDLPRMWASPCDILKFGVRAGDLLVCEGGEGGRCAVLKSIDPGAIIQNALHRVRPRDENDNSFLSYVMSVVSSVGWFDAINNKATIAHFTQDKFGRLGIPLPPPDEQAAIVRFLDHANGKIERAIRAKKKLIALLNEQKQTIIHRAVTRGLDANVKLKPSGIPWLGDVPEHWEVKRLKWVASLQRGYDLPVDRRVQGTFPVVSSGGVIDSHNEMRAKAPGVVIGRYGSTEAVFYIERDFWPHNTSLFVTDFHSNNPKWCFYLLRTISKADYSSKSAVPGVDRKDLHDIYVPEPPKEEQIRLVHGIENQSKSLDALVAYIEREIALLREYRTTLTADVVTGKLDVREAAKKLPVESEESPAAADLVEPAEEDMVERDEE